LIALVYLLATSGHDDGALLGRSGMVVGVQVFLVAVALLSVLAGGRGRGDEPGSDDDGPGGHRPEPRRPPPEPDISWPDFERQFAEHVEAIKGRDEVPTA